MASKADEPNKTSLSNNRRSSRNPVRVAAELMVSEGVRFKVSVLDLSSSGFRIQTANCLEINHKVYLRVPNFQTLQARVAWNYKEDYGCEFSQPLHHSVFEYLSGLFPSTIK